MKLYKSIINFTNKASSIIGYWFSKTYLYSIYFNFRYLPFNQAIHIPIEIYDTYIIGHPKILITANAVHSKMIRIGRFGNNIWQSNKSTLIFWDNGRIEFRGNCKLSRSCHLRVLGNGVLSIGNNFYASSNLNIQCADSISIGKNVTVGWNCTIVDTDYHHYYDNTKKKASKAEKPIRISDNVWIGFNTIIMKDSIIREHSIISAGSVVKGKYDRSNVVIKGNPAIIVRDQVSIDEKNFW